MNRTFQLHRDHDVSGVSGEGVVADGVTFPDGVTVVRWRGERQSTVVWPSVEDVIAIHGHGGATRLVWDAPAPAPSATREDVETITVPRPHVPHGPVGVSRDVADADYLRRAARDLEGFYKPFGANLRATVVALIRDAADAITPKEKP